MFLNRFLNCTVSWISNLTRTGSLSHYTHHMLLCSNTVSNFTSDQFIIRQAKSEEEFSYITRMCKEEQGESSMVGSHMLAHVGPVIKPGFFIGYVNGQRVGHIGATQFGEKINNGFMSGGYLVIDKRHRKKGYGTMLQDFILFNQTISDWNIGADSPNQLIEYYRGKINHQEEGTNRKYIVSCSKVVQALQNITTDSPSSWVRVKPITQVDFDKLLAYDASVFGFTRREFLWKWITIPGSLGVVAVKRQDNDIVGYTVMQYSVVDKQALVGPLYSNNNTVTRLLLNTLANTAIEQQYAESLRLLVPVGANPGAAELMEEEIGFDMIWESKRMYTKGIPSPSHMSRVIATTSPG